MARLQLVAKLRLKRLRGRPEAVRALGALLSAQLGKICQGPPGSMVAACPDAAHMRIGVPCNTWAQCYKTAYYQNGPGQKMSMHAAAATAAPAGIVVGRQRLPRTYTIEWQVGVVCI